jgi:excisionase family DNA binding protein
VQLSTNLHEPSLNLLKWVHGLANMSPLGVSISQAADELGVSPGTVRVWSDMGYIESYRTPGGQRRFSSEQITQFVAALQRDAARADERAAVADP